MTAVTIVMIVVDNSGSNYFDRSDRQEEISNSIQHFISDL
jgi:hypothetical protein